MPKDQSFVSEVIDLTNNESKEAKLTNEGLTEELKGAKKSMKDVGCAFTLLKIKILLPKRRSVIRLRSNSKHS